MNLIKPSLAVHLDDEGPRVSRSPDFTKLTEVERQQWSAYFGVDLPRPTVGKHRLTNLFTKLKKTLLAFSRRCDSSRKSPDAAVRDQ